MRSALGACALLWLLGCSSYDPQPLDPAELLRALAEVTPADGLPALAPGVAPLTSAFEPGDGLTLVEASALGVHRNPRLAWLRAEVGVAQAGLIEAGLLPDPVVGWDSMNAVADSVLLGKVAPTSWLSGFGLTWEVPRPGEIGAREGVADAAISARLAELGAAEWSLVRALHLAYLRRLVAEARLEQSERLAELAQASQSFFARSRALGATTALQESLANLSASAVLAQVVEARSDALEARQALNALLGLRPDAAWVTQDTLAAFALPAALADEDPERLERLVEEACARRPDLSQVLAAYRGAEERLRLEVRSQLPQLTIGTSFSLTLPFLSRFNQPAIRRAERARDSARLRVVAALAELRRDLHDAQRELTQAYALARLYAETLGPAAREALSLTRAAFEAREVTPLEILAAQRQVIDAQTRALAARERYGAARIRLDAAAGRLLPGFRTPDPRDSNDDTDDDSDDDSDSEGGPQ